MTQEEAFKILSNYQSWRKYDGPIGKGPDMPNPTDIGKAIDVALGTLEENREMGTHFIPSNLDEAAIERMRDPDMYLSDATIEEIGDALLKMAHFGAEWMAKRNKEKIEQAFFSGYNECEDRMKKEFERRAMAGEVNNTGYPTTIQLHTFDSSLKNGDKVNIIIIKHEQD